MSKADPTCARGCNSDYSECIGKFSLFPIHQQNACTSALEVCARSCPARQAVVGDTLYRCPGNDYRNTLTPEEARAKGCEVVPPAR